MRPNLPNSISLFRVAMVPVLMVLLLLDFPRYDLYALGVFVVAGASDWLDGYLARRRKQTSTLGAFLDPLADKLLVTAALVCLVDVDLLSAWVAMVVIARELAVTGLRMVAAARDLVISASGWGKVKTLSQMAAIAALIVEPRWIEPGWRLWGQGVTWYLVIVMLVLTVISGIHYFVRAHQTLGAGREDSEGRPSEGGKGD